MVRVADANSGIERLTEPGQSAPMIDVAATRLEGLGHLDSFHEPEGKAPQPPGCL